MKIGDEVKVTKVNLGKWCDENVRTIFTRRLGCVGVVVEIEEDHNSPYYSVQFGDGEIVYMLFEDELEAQ